MSIRTRLLLYCVFLVLLTGGSLMWFAHKDTISTLRVGARNSLNNVMFLLERDLHASHADILSIKLEKLQQLKTDMRLAARMGDIFCESLDATAASSRRYANRFRDFRMKEEELFRKALSFAFFQKKSSGWINPENNKELPVFLARQLSLLTGNEDEVFTVDEENLEKLSLIRRSGDFLVWIQADLEPMENQARQFMEENTRRFQKLIREVHIQQTGFAMALNKDFQIVAGTENAIVSPDFYKVLSSEVFTGAQRRLMILPKSAEDPEEILYLVSFFRPLGLHIVVAAPLNELEATVFSLVSYQLILTGIIMLVAILIGLFFAARLVSPLRRLTETAMQLPEQDLVNLDEEKFIAKLPVKKKDEIGALARSFGFMARELHANILQLLEANAASERLAGELQVARDIQYGILPQPLPEDQRFELYANMLTAKEVGGDLYDFFFLGENEICFVMGDVSDKSVPAALFMSMVVTTLRSLPRDAGADPAQMLMKINTVLALHNPKNMFVTLCIGILDLENGKVRWAAAGHMPPICIGRNGAGELEHSGGMVAGVFDDLEYRLLEDRLFPGESLFLYTDGVSEAFDEKKDMFGKKRILESLGSLYGKNAAEIGETLFEQVRAFAGDAEQSDDIAIMVIRYGNADGDSAYPTNETSNPP